MQQAVSSKQETIRKFTDLKAWQESHKLVVAVYSFTKSFPKDELFGLTNQMRRAAVSITSNISEGFSRPTRADKIHFYSIALGSLTELQNQLFISRDIAYASADQVAELEAQTIISHKLINGLIRSLREGKGI